MSTTNRSGPKEPYYFEEVPFKQLMQRRIEEILLVCSKYDKFMLEEDGRVDEQIFQEYVALNLRYPPKFTQVSRGDEAFEMLGARRFDLVITMLNIGEIRSLELAESIGRAYPDLPVVVLTPFSREVTLKLRNDDLSADHHIFSWLGNDNILLAIVKLMEDRMNVEYDVRVAGVQTIILVEDSVRYYSSYLPSIYRVLFQQARHLMDEGLNEWQQTMRMRCRPKILLAKTYEEALELYKRYKDYLLGIISDISYKRNGVTDEEAGLRLCEYVRNDQDDMPILLQSSHKAHRADAERYNASFMHKHSKSLLAKLRTYVRENYGFGDFAFRDPKTRAEIDRVSSLNELQNKIRSIPDQSFAHHARINDFSKWLKARALFPLANVIAEIQLSDFDSVEHAKQHLFETIKNYRIFENRGTIAEFRKSHYDEYYSFSRIGDGSLGGKGRGLAFVDYILKQHRMRYRYQDVVISIPKTVVLTTEVFETFMDKNNLFERVLADRELGDRKILELFLEARLPERLNEDLYAVLQVMRKPIAVRSSSLLEDSHYQPFAGIYTTYMLPNNAETVEKRHQDLVAAIKAVYASTYYKRSRDYLEATQNVIDEEKMAVIVQEVTGTVHEARCYPTVSGVARSLNFYPVESENPADGIANIALGLGKTVVEGGSSLRVSPSRPKKVIQLTDTDTALKNTQNHFYAIDMNEKHFDPHLDEGATVCRYPVSEAEEDPALPLVVSTLDFESHRLYDGSDRPGKRVVTFAGILKYGMFPLMEILRDLLELASNEMNVPVEIEFAVDLDPPPESQRVFSFLQVRPIVEGLEAEDIRIEDEDRERILLSSDKALGNGLYDSIYDFVYIKPEAFDAAATDQMAATITALNERMKAEDRRYVLVVPGRLGSSDPWLGIPLVWTQISNAKVIVECGLENFRVDPSQGTHFFQNITSLGIAYLTINPFIGDGRLDRDFLSATTAYYQDRFLRHLRFTTPVVAKIAGKDRRAVVLKPEGEPIASADDGDDDHNGGGAGY